MIKLKNQTLLLVTLNSRGYRQSTHFLSITMHTQRFVRKVHMNDLYKALET